MQVFCEAVPDITDNKKEQVKTTERAGNSRKTEDCRPGGAKITSKCVAGYESCKVGRVKAVDSFEAVLFFF